MADPCLSSAESLARRIRDGSLSPVEVVEAHLDRIDDRDGELNAYVEVLDDQARRAAADAERAVESGADLGPLHGVPVAVKDLQNVAGVPTTFGSKPMTDFVAEENDLFVDRLLDAGAIVLGKTNTPEYGHKGTTDNLVVGPTGTPFDASKNAGGSSGGSAAAVAAGLAPLAQGSDGGGSIRIPSAFCGVFGVKPTYRRIARPARPNAFTHTPFSQLGPHARTVRDAALLLDVMAGPHPEDPMVLPESDDDYLAATTRGIEGLSVAYSPNLGVFPVEETVTDIVDDALSAFERAGADVVDVELDYDGRTREEMEDAWLAGFRTNFGALAEDRKALGVDYRGEDRADATRTFVEAADAGAAMSAVDYQRADNVRTDVFLGVQDVFEEHDLLVAPTLAVESIDNAGDDEGNTVGPSELNGEPVDPLIGWCLTYPFNMTGHPVANVPAGLTAAGMPVGMQVAGPRFADERVLAATAAVERTRPWNDAYDTL
ncbi:amidase [Halorarum salinum]|uniref:Amidase n=1 Tax=Halorarum salinum TaxID=2743089 RepID=A0A7D5LAE4_9EURY|nr:amidase family protein [Halobaculum salinum]QLG61767.1 amidase [Halobaculum salinum]